MALEAPGKHGARLTASALAVLLLLLPAGAAPGESVGTYTDQMPGDSLFCPLAGKERRLNDALSGRPLVVFLTDIHYGVNNPLGEKLAELQKEYGPWFSWAGVLIGEADREEIEKVRAASPLRFESCFHDVEGRWWQSLGLGVLPSAVVVNEDGYVLGRFGSTEEGSIERLSFLLEESARSCNLRGRDVIDFRLPEAGTERLPSLLDVAEKDFTMIFFLQTSCPPCFRELKLLDRVRNRYGDRVGLVTIFHNSEEDGLIESYLAGSGVSPDYVLADPVFSQRLVYRVTAVPLLLVVGPEGRIIFSRKGFESLDAWSLAADLDVIFWDSSAYSSATPFGEARRIHGEALQFLADGRTDLAAQYWERALELFPPASSLYRLLADAYRTLGRNKDAARAYSRYLSEQPRAYDLTTVKGEIRSLIEASP